MCTMGQCQKHLGGWVQFQTPWGMHRGVVERVTHQGVLMRVPRQYAPVSLASAPQSDEDKLGAALAQWGYGRGAPGYGAYGGGWGRPGYGWWGGGWLWWWLAFSWLFLLAFLW